MKLPHETKYDQVIEQPKDTLAGYQSDGLQIQLIHRRYRSEVPGQTDDVPPAAQHNNLMDDIADRLPTADAQVIQKDSFSDDLAEYVQANQVRVYNSKMKSEKNVSIMKIQTQQMPLKSNQHNQRIYQPSTSNDVQYIEKQIENLGNENNESLGKAFDNIKSP